MLVRIVRDLTPEEIQKRIEKLEKALGMSFEKLEELFIDKKLDTKSVSTYFELAELVDSYKGYVESGELDYTAEETRDLSPKQVAMLTPKRIELLYKLAVLRVESISDLTQKVKRNVKNVYQDLQVLCGFGFVTLNKRRKQAIVPETLVKEITFLIR
jgi:hypothetical protein